MRWPDWLSQHPLRDRDDENRESPSSESTAVGSWETNLNSTNWSHYTSPQTIFSSVALTAATLAFLRLYKTYLRRIPNADYLKPGLFRRRSIYGYVTAVGDADNFRIFHTPGGRLAGWGWLAGRRVSGKTAKALKDKTIHLRLAGVDAPELAHFGKPAQPYAKEAYDWLKSSVLHRYVRAYPYRRDQYDRIVAAVYMRRWLFFRTDIGLDMLERGLATVYEAKYGSEFGQKEMEYRAAEARAKSHGAGLWRSPGLVGVLLGQKAKEPESPRDFKTRMSANDKKKK